MKKILLIYRAKTDKSKKSATLFSEKIQNLTGKDCVVESCEISELFFEIDQDLMSIYHPTKGFNLSDFDLVVVRHIGPCHPEAHAIAVYCQSLGIKYTDTYLNRLLPDSKISSQFALFAGGIKDFPTTFYGPVSELKRRLPELGDTAVLKDSNGSKGRLNFKITSSEQLQKNAEDNPDTFFVLQKFIPNNSDLRILVLNEESVLVIKRIGDSESHLNNTSQGGKAVIIPLSEVDAEILKTAERASKLLKLQVAGVDVVFDENTGEHYILEVNNAPQISSGSFLEEKAELYANMLKSL